MQAERVGEDVGAAVMEELRRTMGAVMNRKLLPKMAIPILTILALVRMDVYLRGLQIAVKRSKAMARRAPDSMHDRP